MKNFKKLRVWEKGMDIVKLTYRLTNCLPEGEKFGLISQMKRSAVSIPSNIAEGSSTSTNKHHRRFLEIALGSCYELETQVLICYNLLEVDGKVISELLYGIREEQKMLISFMNRLS